METVPPVADQLTAVFVAPLTVAVNCCEPPVNSEAETGEIDTAAGTLTVTAADADLVESATLVAVAVYVPLVVGAVYRPLDDTVPPLIDQVTLVLADPVTLAVNCCEPPASSEAETGEIDTATGTLTVTVADADLVESATLVAVTV